MSPRAEVALLTKFEGSRNCNLRQTDRSRDAVVNAEVHRITQVVGIEDDVDAVCACASLI